MVFWACGGDSVLCRVHSLSFEMSDFNFDYVKFDCEEEIQSYKETVRGFFPVNFNSAENFVNIQGSVVNRKVYLEVQWCDNSIVIKFDPNGEVGPNPTGCLFVEASSNGEQITYNDFFGYSWRHKVKTVVDCFFRL